MPFLRKLPALLAAISLTLQPLAAQERPYFRSVNPGAGGLQAVQPGAASLSVSGNRMVPYNSPVSIVPSTDVPAPIAWSISPALRNGLSLDPATGQVHGSSTIPGSTTHTLRASGGGLLAETTFDLTVGAASANPPVIASYPSSFRFDPGSPVTISPPSVTGGSGALTWFANPNGPLSLSSSTGVLSWASAVAGNYGPYSVTVRDANGALSTSNPFTLDVSYAAIALGIVNDPGINMDFAAGATSMRYQASGGLAPYTYELSSGSLPPGVALASTGELTGAPNLSAVGGTYVWSVRVRDSQQPPAVAQDGPKGVNVIDSRALSFAYATTAIEASAGVQGSFPSPVVNGGSQPLTFSSSSSQVTVNGANGSGTYQFPTASETPQPVTVTATDAAGRTASASLSFTVKAPPQVVTPALPGATQGQTGYSATFAATGGTGTPTWTLKVGSTTIGNGGTLGNTNLIWNAGNGTIAGTVSSSAASVSNITVTATDTQGRTSAVAGPFTLAISPRASAPIYDASNHSTVGQTTSFAPITPASGGTAPLRYSWVTAPQDTTNITIDPTTGVVTVGPGLPFRSQHYTFQVWTQDANNVNGNFSSLISIVHFARPTITTAALGTATQGQPSYSQSMAVTSGSGTGTWTLSVNGTTVPAGGAIGDTGLLWWANGTISGNVSPTANPQSLTFGYTDNGGRQADPKTLTLNVAQNAPVTATYATPAPTAGTTNVPIPQTTVTPGGGSGTYTYAMTSGSPSWMQVDAQGRITGTPTATGSFPYAVVVSDAQNAGLKGETPTATLVVTGPVAISTNLVERPMVNNGYSFQMTASGGNGGPYTWSQTGLPGTLTLSSGGLITGTPTAAASYTITFTARDSDQRATSKQLTVTVDNPASAASNALLVAATTTAQGGYVILNNAGIASNAPNLHEVIKANASSYSFYGLHSNESVTLRYSQTVAFSRFTSRIRNLAGTVVLAIETSTNGTTFTQVDTVTLTATMPGAVNDTEAGGKMVTIDVPLSNVTQGTHARIRKISGPGWTGIGPGGFN